MLTLVRINTVEDFWQKVNKRGPLSSLGTCCWEWEGGTNGQYGVFCLRNKKYLVHRFSFILKYGKVKKGRDVHHKCENTLCVRPSHLKALKPKRHAEIHPHGLHTVIKTHCAQGHEYTDDNTHVRTNGKRECRQCMRDRTAARRAQGKVSARPTKKRCSRGHKMTRENVGHLPSGEWYCKGCHRESQQERRVRGAS